MAAGDIAAFTPVLQNSQTVDAPTLMKFFNAIRDAFNGEITNNQLVALAGVVESKLNLSALNLVNLARNGGFEAWGSTTAVPTDWTAVLTATIARDTAEQGHGNYAVKITGAGAADEGISITLTNLKASTTYRVSVRVKVTAGDTASITTTGATTNMDEDATGTSWATVTGTFITDGSGTDVVLQLLAQNDGDIVWFDDVMVTEGTAKVGFIPNRFQDRGDPAAVDSTSITTDGSWHDYDISAIVPPTATEVVLFVNIVSDTAGRELSFRKNGRSNQIAIQALTIQVANRQVKGPIVVAIGPDGVLETHGTSATWTTTEVTVLGWHNG